MAYCRSCRRRFQDEAALDQHLSSSNHATSENATNQTPEVTRTWFTFPTLHQSIADEVSDHIASTRFRESASGRGCTKACSTYVMGKFICVNETCSTDGWSSKKIAIVIKGYPNNEYNAVVYNQRCKDCDQLGNLELDEQSYIDRVAYRLRKWAGAPTKRPVYNRKNGPPHQSRLCEGCKKGVCKESGDRDMFTNFQSLSLR